MMLKAPTGEPKNDKDKQAQKRFIAYVSWLHK